MMDRFVLDTSVTMGWCFEDENDKYSTAILKRMPDAEAVVPAIWPLKVANVLCLAERRGRIAHVETSRFLAILERFRLVIQPVVPSLVFLEILPLASQNS